MEKMIYQIEIKENRDRENLRKNTRKSIEGWLNNGYVIQGIKTLFTMVY